MKASEQSSINQWWEAKLREKSFWGQFFRKWRRLFYTTFRRDQVEASIRENRKGDCHRCGACCEFVYKCPFLGKDAQNLSYCRVYGDLRPTNCHYYPFDALDSEVDRCGFKFKKIS